MDVFRAVVAQRIAGNDAFCLRPDECTAGFAADRTAAAAAAAHSHQRQFELCVAERHALTCLDAVVAAADAELQLVIGNLPVREIDQNAQCQQGAAFARLFRGGRGAGKQLVAAAQIAQHCRRQIAVRRNHRCRGVMEIAGADALPVVVDQHELFVRQIEPAPPDHRHLLPTLDRQAGTTDLGQYRVAMVETEIAAVAGDAYQPPQRVGVDAEACFATGTDADIAAAAVVGRASDNRHGVRPE